MIDEVIAKIREAETAADNTVREANAKAKEIAAAAVLRAESLTEDAKREAKDRYKAESARAVEEANAQTLERLKEGAAKARELEAEGERRLEAAVKLIVDAITS